MRDRHGLTRLMRLPFYSHWALCLGLLGIFPGAFSASGDEPSVFGQETQSEAALIGILYDLKQTQDHQSTGDYSVHYFSTLDEFLSKGWDEAVLNRFYRVSKPLYTTQIFIPNMDANAAPKAFGAEKTVKPSHWVIHYKGQVSPPEPGTYRFWGCADDALAVAVNGKTVLVSIRGNKNDLPHVTWQPSEPDAAQAADDFLRPGDWMELKAGDIMDLDVIIGERPGGEFNAFLMIEKKGAKYARDSHNFPILPIFQVGAYDTPAVNDLNTEPVFAKGYPLWKSYQ